MGGGGGDDAIDDAVPGVQDVAHICQPELEIELSELHSKRPSWPLVPYWREEPALGTLPLYSTGPNCRYMLSLSRPACVEKLAIYQSISPVALKEQLSLSL